MNTNSTQSKLTQNLIQMNSFTYRITCDDGYGGESTFTYLVIQAEDNDEIEKRLIWAITDWVNNTQEGKELWNEDYYKQGKYISLGQLNDLNNLESLIPYLNKQKIKSIQFNDREVQGVWNLDTNFVDEDLINPELRSS